MVEDQFGSIKIKLAEVIAESSFSKNQVANRSGMQRTQLNKYCNGKIQRLDISIIAKLCCVLQCSISDILEYVPSERINEDTKK